MIPSTEQPSIDINVFCRKCGVSIGYVVKGGHADWVCETCSGTGKVEAAYPVRGWSWNQEEAT